MREMKYVAISGSYRKFPDELEKAIEAFRDFGVEVLSPKSSTIISSLDGFVSLEWDIVPDIKAVQDSDLAKAIRLVENSHLKAIQQSDALWILMPEGYLGIATAFEISWALAHNVPVFYDAKHEFKEPIIKAYARPVQSIEHLVSNFESMPKVDPIATKYFLQRIHQTCTRGDHNANIAVGPVIVDYSKRYRKGQKRDILLVKTHKWDGRFSIVGERINPEENLQNAFQRAVLEQTKLSCIIDKDICTFDEIPNSGYYRTRTSRIFVDKVVKVRSRIVSLDHRAEDYLWIPPNIALEELDIEPNARKTIILYDKMCA